MAGWSNVNEASTSDRAAGCLVWVYSRHFLVENSSKASCPMTSDFANLFVMSKKLPFLVLGYLLGLISLVASLPALLYTKAATNGPVAEDANCKGFPGPTA